MAQVIAEGVAHPTLNTPRPAPPGRARPSPREGAVAMSVRARAAGMLWGAALCTGGSAPTQGRARPVGASWHPTHPRAEQGAPWRAAARAVMPKACLRHDPPRRTEGAPTILGTPSA